MHLRRFVPDSMLDRIVLIGLTIIALHLVNALMLRPVVPSPRRLVWFVALLVAIGVSVYALGRLGRTGKGWLAFVFGLPALLVGGAIHAVHVAQVGFKQRDATGLPLLIAGLALTIMGLAVLVQAVKPWWRRLLLLPVGLVLTFFVLFPVTLGVVSTNLPRLPVDESNAPSSFGFNYEDVRFETAEGLTLSAWYIPTQNGAAVITVHGAFRGRDRTMDHAAVLARHGYGVLMLDLEGYGNSEGRANAFGWVGARDVHAAVMYLRGRPDVHPEKIGGLGLSMGGEVLLQAAGESTALKAIVVEGVSSRTPDDVDELPGAETSFTVVPFQWVLATTIRLITGESIPPPLKQLAQQIGPRRVLLISAASTDERVLSRLYHAVGGASFTHWEIAEDKHLGALDLHAGEYERRVIEFFNDALLGGADK